MKRAVEGNDRRPAGDVAGQLHGALDGFGTTVAEEDLVQPSRRNAGQLFGQGDHGLMVGHHRDMDQLVDLSVDCLKHVGVTVTEVGDPNATAEIEVAAAVPGKQVRTLGVVDDQRGVPVEDGSQVGPLPGQPPGGIIALRLVSNCLHGASLSLPMDRARDRIHARAEAGRRRRPTRGISTRVYRSDAADWDAGRAEPKETTSTRGSASVDA